jgi:hypothetical protein
MNSKSASFETLSQNREFSIMTKVLSALYDSYDDAAAAVRELENAGFPNGDISVVASNADNRYAAGTQDARSKTTRTAEDTAAGIGLVGAATGLLAGLGILAIPGIGPVVAAGWLVSTAAGAAAGIGIGAITGGLVGALTSSGVDERDAHIYAEGVKRGGTLVTVRVPDEETGRAEAILRNGRHVDLYTRALTYGPGWDRFDESGIPLDTAAIERERATRRKAI